MTRWAFLDHPGPIAFAHRGGAADRPENTMAAFGRAVELGYRYLETDAQVTADGYLVAFHDDTLDRVADRPGRIAEMSWAEVQEARVGDEPIPLLEDVIGAWPGTRVNVDAKGDASVELLAQVIERTGAHDRACVGSFSDRRVARFRRLTADRVCTAMGTSSVVRLRLGSLGIPTGAYASGCAQVPVRKGPVPVVDRRFLAAAHRRSLPVHVWTVDEAAEMDRLLDLGVDGIMTDRLEVLKGVLERRGQWA